MLMTLTPILALALALNVQGHAVVTEPVPRKTGTAHAAACGASLTKSLERDIAGPIEDAVEDAVDPYTCNPYLCRGYQYEDNTDSVLAVKAGDILYFHVDLIAGHRPGYANTSVIDTAANAAIGEPLRSWDLWPGENTGADRDDVNFNVTIPDTLSSLCDVGGKCTIQWFWYATGNEQTYESCVDFYVEA